jgi:hypothetical protein
MASYHDVHYQTFHFALPQIVLTDGFEHFVDALVGQRLPEMLTGVWSHVAKTLNDGRRPPKDQVVVPSTFKVVIDEPHPDWTTVLIITPQVRGGLEAAMVVVMFDDEFEHVPLYFTCEAPAIADAPYMIGHWTDVGQRSNLGPLFDVSVESMLAFSKTQVPLPSRKEDSQPRTAPGRGLREIPDIDDILDRRTRSIAKSGTRPEGVLQGNAKIGDANPRPSPTMDAPPTELPRVSGPIKFNCTWDDEPTELASDALSNLYRLAGSGGRALVMGAKKTKGLGRKVSSYVQFMWSADGLLIEIQGDYSFWGLSIPSRHWPQFESCGLTIPTRGVGNFSRRIVADASHEERLKALTDVFGAFLAVLNPSGKVDSSHF